MKKTLSIVIPTFNEEKNIAHLINELDRTLSLTEYEYEYVFVNDGSKDETMAALKTAAWSNPKVYYIELSRNFGKDYALKAGIDMARGDAVITMDADLQHPPHLLPQMLQQWEDGYDVVYTYREDSNPHADRFQKMASMLFYKFINRLSDLTLENGISDFRLLDRKVVDEMHKITEYEIFFRGMTKWVGFLQMGIPYTPAARHTGEASYSFARLLKLAIGSIMAFSVKPLYIATGLGLFFSLASLLYIPYVLISYFYGFDAVSGWASLIATVAFFGGLQLLVLGIIGSYLGKIFIQTKNRPNYIVRSTNMVKKHDIVKL